MTASGAIPPPLELAPPLPLPPLGGAPLPPYQKPEKKSLAHHLTTDLPAPKINFQCKDSHISIWSYLKYSINIKDNNSDENNANNNNNNNNNICTMQLQNNRVVISS